MDKVLIRWVKGTWVGGARNLWSEQPLAPPAEDVITGLEFLVDLPSDPSWVSRMKQKNAVGKKLETNQVIQLSLTKNISKFPSKGKTNQKIKFPIEEWFIRLSIISAVFLLSSSICQFFVPYLIGASLGSHWGSTDLTKVSPTLPAPGARAPCHKSPVTRST